MHESSRLIENSEFILTKVLYTFNGQKSVYRN